MKHFLTLNVCSIGLMVLSGCGTTITSSLLTAGGAATGALIGHKAGKGKLHWTAAGAAAGVAAGTLVNYKLAKQLQTAHQEGYNYAMNQSVRQHYWLLQNIQKTAENAQMRKMGYYPVTRPEYTLNGITFKESTEYVQMYE